MKNIRIYRGERRSAGARALGRAMGVKVLRWRNSRYRPRAGHVVINWGCSEAPGWVATALNAPAAVARATNKLQTFQVLTEKSVPTVEFTQDHGQAAEWLKSDGLVIERHLLNGTQGRGLRVVRDVAEMQHAPLYTRYFKASHEYRVHVVGGKVIDSQEKRRRPEYRGNEVRNLAHGWVFCREDVNIPPMVEAASVWAVRYLGLDFGAVDIKANRQGTRCAVLEVNTAPGLEGTTLERYAQSLLDFVRTRLD